MGVFYAITATPFPFFPHTKKKKYDKLFALAKEILSKSHDPIQNKLFYIGKNEREQEACCRITYFTHFCAEKYCDF